MPECVRTGVYLHKKEKEEWERRFPQVTLSKRLRVAMLKDLKTGNPGLENFNENPEPRLDPAQVPDADLIKQARVWFSLNQRAIISKSKLKQYRADELKEHLLKKYNLTIRQLCAISEKLIIVTEPPGTSEAQEETEEMD